MCGIAGIITSNNSAGEYRESIKKMVDSLYHRGPDEKNEHFLKNCALGHARLSIVDLKTGSQPMFNSDKKVIVVFNGEIYGYREIKPELSGYRFRTSTDTEVILALYEKHGEDFLKYLPGMFSFALWDDREQKLICARDRSGEKPFFYAWGPKGEFVFASEIKALIASGLIKPRVNLEEISFFLKHIYVQPDHTIYDNIYVLPPAHKIVVKNGKVSVSRYWFMPEINQSISLEEATEEFKRLIDQAVRRQLIADVPVGVFLSGGLDSSTVVALARNYVKDLKTFSFGFKDDSSNEMHFAKEVSRFYNTDHFELYEGEHESIGELLLKIQNVYDEPSADSANIPTYLISRLARKHVKVVLAGEGADELLGGYVAYRPFLYSGFGTYPDWLNGLVKQVITTLKYLGIGREALIHQIFLGAFYGANYSSLWEAHIRRSKAFSEDELKELGLESVVEPKLYRPSWPIIGTIDDVMRTDFENFLPGDIHVHSDRASMANSLELRSPFLDADLIYFCLSLPSRLKIARNADKIILRKAFSGKWPAALRQRKKHGFVAPFGKWLSEDKSVKAVVNEYLNDPNKMIFSLIPFDKIRPMIFKNDYKKWALLHLSLWLESHPAHH